MSEKHLEGIEPDLLKKLRRDYCKQKSNAAKRGIEWQFTFESWVKFWGDDVHKRGTGHDRLCMQRFHDAGPYHPDNVRKDYAMQNARTAGVIVKVTGSPVLSASPRGLPGCASGGKNTLKMS